MTYQEYRDKENDEFEQCIKEMVAEGYTQEEIDEWIAEYQRANILRSIDNWNNF